MPGHPSHRYYVGLIVPLDGNEWMITACDFIRDAHQGRLRQRAIRRRKSELSDPAIGYHGEKRNLLLKEIPLPTQNRESVD